VKAIGLIDTGAQVTVGNLALREALSKRRGQRDQYDDVVIGITEDIRPPRWCASEHHGRADDRPQRTGALQRSAHLRHWKLTSQPVLLIGMDVLGALDTLVIDYSRSELQLRTR